MAKRKPQVRSKDNVQEWFGHVRKLPQPGKELLWQKGDEFYYKREELLFLPPAHQEVIYRIMLLTGKDSLQRDWIQKVTTEQIDEFMNLWKPCEGCVPADEFDGDVSEAIVRKFRIPLDVACEMARQYHEHKMGTNVGFQPVPLVEPSTDDTTHFGIVDWDNNICYIRDHEKAWVFKWYSLTAFSNWILAVMRRVLQVYSAMPQRKAARLQDIKTDPMFQLYDAERNPFGANPNPHE